MTTYNTGNPIGSTEVKDLYDNAQNFDTLSTTTTLETVPDRLGVPRMSLHGFEQEAKRRFESIKFQPPIPYAPGIEVTTSSLTVDYLGVLYYALPSALPFTTGAWNPAQWSPLQNTYPGNELLVFDDYSAASAAAATLPDGQAVKIETDETRDSRRTWYVVQGGVLVFDDYAPDIIRLSSDADLKSYMGRSTVVEIGARRYEYAPGSSAEDNGWSVLVGADSRRWFLTGSMALTSVTPEMFGAKGDGVADDSDPIQRALDTKLTVTLVAKYRITNSLTFYGQKIEGLGVTVNSGTWAMTTIIADGNFPAFVPQSDSPASADISGLFIWYADTTPLAESGNDQKIGFAFLNPGFPNPDVANPQFTKISNCLVKGGWRAYDASGGAYLFKLERVWSWSCRFGFRHIGGTTLSMDTCYALFGEQAYFIQGVANLTVQNCAMDQMIVTTTTPQRSAAVFANIPGLNINGFYTELNQVQVDAGSLVMLIECVGSVSNVTRWRESLSCTTGQEVYGYRVYGGRVRLSGFAQQVAGMEGFQYTGSGIVMGLLAQEGAIVELDISDFKAPTGGAPAARYSVGVFTGASVTNTGTDTSGGLDVSLPMVAGTGVAFTPTLDAFTVTGRPIVTGSYRRAGTMVFMDIQIYPNGGTVASVPGTSNIPNLPVPAVGRPVASVMNGDFSGGHGYINGSMLVMPYLAASSSPIYISAAYPVL